MLLLIHPIFTRYKIHSKYMIRAFFSTSQFLNLFFFRNHLMSARIGLRLRSNCRQCLSLQSPKVITIHQRVSSVPHDLISAANLISRQQYSNSRKLYTSSILRLAHEKTKPQPVSDTNQPAPRQEITTEVRSLSHDSLI